MVRFCYPKYQGCIKGRPNKDHNVGNPHTYAHVCKTATIGSVSFRGLWIHSTVVCGSLGFSLCRRRAQDSEQIFFGSQMRKISADLFGTTVQEFLFPWGGGGGGQNKTKVEKHLHTMSLPIGLFFKHDRDHVEGPTKSF